MKTTDQLEQDAARQTAAFMLAAARTAPKTRGVDLIQTAIITEAPEREKLVAKMREIAVREKRPGFARDAGNIENSPAIVIIGVTASPVGMNCGFCGQPTCEALTAVGGVCAFNAIDLGIAIASAAETAGRFHLDNRVMYSIGRAALDLKIFGPDVHQALGIPLSVTGKSPFFDRKA
jgi:uncharacterized ferredoxin-like protein